MIDMMRWAALVLSVLLVGASLPVAFRFRNLDRGAIVGGALLLMGIALGLWSLP